MAAGGGDVQDVAIVRAVTTIRGGLVPRADRTGARSSDPDAPPGVTVPPSSKERRGVTPPLPFAVVVVPSPLDHARRAPICVPARRRRPPPRGPRGRGRRVCSGESFQR